MKNSIVILIAILFLIACKGQNKEINNKENQKMENIKSVVFGGGCFWCIEGAFDMLKGVEKAESGYAGGHIENPTYKEVCEGNTGHAEVVKITYNSTIISYEELMDVFFFLHDPTQLNRQGNDVGTQYRSVIFYQNEIEKTKAEKALEISENSGLWKGKYVTEILPLNQFWKAEDYHQGYFQDNPNQPYCSAVVAPKIAKFRKYFSEKEILKEN